MDKVGAVDVLGLEIIEARTNTSIGGLRLAWRLLQTFNGREVALLVLGAQSPPTSY